MAANARQIIVIGAGIGGLAAALALQRRGFRVAVYERAPEIREIGAGVVIAPNARRALRDLGVDAALEALSCSVSVLHTCDYRTGEIVRTNRNEQIIERQGMGVLQVHRADLHALLMEAVRANDPAALWPGHEFVGLDQDAAGVSVTFANGARRRADVVIGADGNTSAVRSCCFPARRRGSTARSRSAPSSPTSWYRPWSASASSQCIRPRRYLLHYPLRRGRIMNLIGCGQTASWQEEGWSIPATNEEFEEHYRTSRPELLALIRASAGGLFKWGCAVANP